MTAKIPLDDCIGNKFGRWKVIKEGLRDSRGGRTMECICDCGTIKDVSLAGLRAGLTQSCGCILIEKSTKRLTTHDMSHTPEYKTWASIKRRCTMPSQDRYEHYGGRGICMCERWLNSFENFFEDMGLKPDGYSIERVDNDGNYEPANCKWIPLCEQQRNTTQNHFLTYNGIKDTIAGWERRIGFNAGTLKRRILLGWDTEKAITTPKREKGWKMSSEQKLKMSRGKFDVFKGIEHIGTWDIQSECANKLDISRTRLSEVLHGIHKTVGGYTARYQEVV